MNYIVTTLYSYINDEELTFDLFVSLIVQKELKQMFTSNVAEYHLRNYMIEQLIKEYLLDIFIHFKRLQLNIEVITGSWLMTLFCGYFPYQQIMPILDNIFLDDWKAVFRIILALLQTFKKDLLSQNDLAFAA